MEDGLGGYNRDVSWEIKDIVLILVVVEDGLGVRIVQTDGDAKMGLNPCFSGRWSRRAKV